MSSVGSMARSENNDLFCYDTMNNEWKKIITSDIPPTPRDCHSCVVKDSSIYIFGGNCGFNFVNDFYEYKIINNTWNEVNISESSAKPSARHSHMAVVYEDFMYLFGGIDASKPKNDFFMFNFRTSKWTELKHKEEDCWPKPRYNSLITVKGNKLFLYGGTDGKQVFTDLLYFDLLTMKWGLIDYFQDEISINKMQKFISQSSPKAPHCYLSNTIKECYIIGASIEIKKLNDLSKFINKKKYSDIKLIIKKKYVIRAHKIILAKCEFFDCMFSSEMKEKDIKVFYINDVSYPIMMQLIKFLYTDTCEVTLENVMALFKAADIYGIKKLKYNCQQTLISNICVDNAANIFAEADRHFEDRLRDISLKYILKNFDAVSKTEGFDNLIRHNPELAIEVLRQRKTD